jgi:hypothetical protein
MEGQAEPEDQAVLAEADKRDGLVHLACSTAIVAETTVGAAEPVEMVATGGLGVAVGVGVASRSLPPRP